MKGSKHKVLMFKDSLSYFSDSVQKRGVAYKCATCGKEGPRGPMFFHVLKDHRTVDEVPFYCSLCHYKSFNKDQLNCHVTTFAIHNRIKGIRHQGAPDEEFHVRNTNPREIMIGVDLLPQGQQENREV